jgi:ADP-ribosylation factor protein 1
VFDRIGEAREELLSVMNDDLLRGAALLVFANKQDLPGSISTADIVSKLELGKNFRTVPWHVQGTIATSGEGLYEGLDWLAATLNESPARQRAF